MRAIEKTEEEVIKVQDLTFDPKTGIVELGRKFPDHKMFWGEEFHPIPKSGRTWGYLPYIGGWLEIISPVDWGVGAAVIALGLNLIFGLFAAIIASAVLYGLVIAQSHAGARYGLAEPQLTRTRWGLYGGWIASLIRAIPALGWFGINTYLFTEMADGLYLMHIGKISDLASLVEAGPKAEFLLNPALFITVFAIMFLAQALLLSLSKIIRSQPAVKWLFQSMIVVAPIFLAVLWGYTMNMVHWDFPLLFKTSVPRKESLSTIYLFLLVISSFIADLETISMSNPDILRFAKSQRVQMYSQLSLIPYFFIMLFCAMTGGVATYITYGTPVYDPFLLAFIMNIPTPLKVFLVLIMGYITLCVQVYANLIPPAYDISNFVPGKLKFWMGVLIALVIAALMQAWSLYLSALSFLEGWLNLYGTFLAPVVGIAIFDYVIIRRLKLPIDHVYIPKGKFWYWHGINPAAVISLVITAAIELIPQIPYHALINASASWLGVLLGGLVYVVLMKVWVIPKWQPFLKGGLIHGYVDPEIEPLFNPVKASEQNTKSG